MQKKLLSELLKKYMVDIDDIKLPILNKATEQIVINCNDGEICDIKPILRVKK